MFVKSCVCKIRCLWNMFVKWYVCEMIYLWNNMFVNWYVCEIILFVKWFICELICLGNENLRNIVCEMNVCQMMHPDKALFFRKDT